VGRLQGAACATSQARGTGCASQRCA
jgi:hypothetical protein